MERCRGALDDEAFAELVRRYRDRVYRLVLSVLGREFAGDAEEVAQEVFLRVHHALASFRMSEQEQMDRLLRAAMADSPPRLSAAFDQKVATGVRRQRRTLRPVGKLILAGYSVTAVALSAVVLERQDVGWGLTAASLAIPLVLAATLVRRNRRASSG